MGLGTPLLAWEGPQVEYSANTRIETADGIMEDMVFHSPGKERRELTTSGEPMTMIILWDKKVMWTLMPEANAYLEMSLDESQDKPTPPRIRSTKPPRARKTSMGSRPRKAKSS